MGKKRANVVIAHKLLVIAYYVLKAGEPYNELGANYLETRKSITTEELMVRRLQKQGYTVTHSNDATA